MIQEKSTWTDTSWCAGILTFAAGALSKQSTFLTRCTNAKSTTIPVAFERVKVDSVLLLGE